MERIQKKIILSDLQRKIVILSGPRQSGKTTLAKSIVTEFKSSIFLSYDSSEDRKIILNKEWAGLVELIVLDQIDKMPKWNNYLKEIYDKKEIHQKFLILASARLESFYREDGFLLSRCFLHRLLPLSPSECASLNHPYSIDWFLETGGFPEPFLSEDLTYSNQWRLQYVDSLIGPDMLEFEDIQNLNAIRHTFEILRHRVGSPISYSSLANDIGISEEAVKRYIEMLEGLYIIFRVTPHINYISRKPLNELKLYFFDIGLVKGARGAKFENLIALSLLKHTYFQVDTRAHNYTLHYLRTKDGKEVDFALLLDETIEKAIEVKSGDSGVHPALRYFSQKCQLSCFQVTKDLKYEKSINGIEIIKSDSFLKALSL